MDPMYVGNEFGPVGMAIAIVAMVLLLLGVGIIRRIMPDPDESPDHWRSHRRT